MKQLHTLPDGKLVLIDWVKLPKKVTMEAHINRVMEIHAYIPTLEQDRSTWLELSERCGGKLEGGVHYVIRRHPSFEGEYLPSAKIAIPTPQTEDLWEEAIKNANEYAANKCYREELCRKVDYDLEFINYLKKTYENPTRKS